MSGCPVPPEFRDRLTGALEMALDPDASVERQIRMLTDAAEEFLADLPYDADAHDCAIWFLEYHG